MFTNAQFNRLENLVQKFLDGLRLKEQQDRIEAQQLRIEKQLAEVLKLLERDDMTAEEEAAAVDQGNKIVDKLKGIQGIV